MQKQLEITLKLIDGVVEAEVYEPESGAFDRITNYYAPDDHHEFDADIGAEIYSWLQMMADAKED